MENPADNVVLSPESPKIQPEIECNGKTEKLDKNGQNIPNHEEKTRVC